jgi:plastocyanin
VEILHRVRDRNGRLRLLLVAATLIAVGSCERPPDPDTLPDELLQTELGFTVADRVHRVTLSGGETEQANPIVVSVEPGSHVEFVTSDWLIHEVIFEADSVTGERWAFLEKTDQAASPPLIDKESRYVLSFVGAPVGRYPYRIEGNGGPGRGVIVVAEPVP